MTWGHAAYGDDEYGETSGTSLPIFDQFSPAKAATLGNTSVPLTFSARPAGGGEEVLPAGQPVILALRPSGAVEIVYDGTTFLGAYSTSSTRSGIAGEDFSIVRTGGWEAPFATLLISAKDTDGNFGQDLYSVNVPGDGATPVINNFNPAQGSEIAPTQALTFDVTDNSGSFARIFVIAHFARSGIEEVIHDGDGFRGLYASGSSARSIISGGYRYTVQRSGGWPSSPEIRIFAIDASGNEGRA